MLPGPPHHPARAVGHMVLQSVEQRRPHEAPAPRLGPLAASSPSYRSRPQRDRETGFDLPRLTIQTRAAYVPPHPQNMAIKTHNPQPFRRLSKMGSSPHCLSTTKLRPRISKNTKSSQKEVLYTVHSIVRSAHKQHRGWPSSFCSSTARKKVPARRCHGLVAKGSKQTRLHLRPFSLLPAGGELVF